MYTRGQIAMCSDHIIVRSGPVNIEGMYTTFLLRCTQLICPFVFFLLAEQKILNEHIIVYVT